MTTEAMTTQLILLGTAGGPTPKVSRNAPSQVLVCNGAAYVVDCGNGVARQLTLAGVPLPSLRAVFLTHHHSDHNADYGNLLLLAWASNLVGRVRTVGPPPLVDMTRAFLEMNRSDIRTRIVDEGRPPLEPLIDAREISAGGVVYEDGNVRVTAALVDHPPIETAFAYRFDTADRSIVVSGDTAPCRNLVELAAGADVLVHEAIHLPALEDMIARDSAATRLREHLTASHTSAADAGRIAQEAGVGTLVLSHLVPSDAGLDDVWLEHAARGFDGKVVVGHDLMVL